MSETGDCERLELIGVLGFNGCVASGLKIHPNRQHVIYPLGCTIIIEDINTRKQDFLHGHTSDVVSIAVSKSGRYIASGQVTHMGFKADIIVWDFDKREEMAKFVLHKVKVQSLAFSPNDKYLLSLGGQDDGSIVIWSMDKREPICGSPAQTQSAGNTECVAYAHNRDDLFVTAGENTLRVWELDVANRKMRPTEVTMGQIKRKVTCAALSEDDKTLYCGTSSGDILGVNMDSKLFQHFGPDKDKLSLGITALVLLPTGEILVGAGDGTVNVIKQVEKQEGRKTVLKFVRTKKQQQVNGSVSSISLRGAGHQFFVGTDKSQIYKFNFGEFTHELLNTCHYSAVNDITFPLLADSSTGSVNFFGTSDLFATCSFQDIRVWHTPQQKELLRISVPNMTCYSIDFVKDGTAIVSGWDDSRIRAFYPESGKLMYVINDAHKKGVTAVATSSDCQRIVSGGGEGQVRVWLVEEKLTHKGGTHVTTLVEAMKEHTNAVSCIRISRDDTQCVSSSADGTCIIWDLQSFKRKQIIFANTLFRCVCYRPDECQIITSGTDRKISYWEMFDGSLIRELDGSRSGSVNGMDISLDGDRFVTAGDDKLVKVWKYNEGEVTHLGLGHSSSITRARICPNSKLIITVSEDGAVFIWKFPQ